MFEMVKVPFLKQTDAFELINLNQLGLIHNWLSSQDTGASMQEIKRAISWSKADREMELFVSNKLIERDKRLYSSLVPEVSVERLKKLLELATTITAELSYYLLSEFPLLKNNPWLITYSVSRLKQKDLTRIIALPTKTVSPVMSTCQKCGHYLFIDVDGSDNKPIGLANYFSGLPITPKSQQLFEKLGDVNANYFLEMAGKQLRLIQDGQQPRRSRSNIFIEALVAFDYIIETDHYHLTGELSVIDKTDLVSGLGIIEKAIMNSLISHQRINEVEHDLLKALVFNELLKSNQNTKEVIFLTKNKQTSK